jgi:hypothetical protein
LLVVSVWLMATLQFAFVVAWTSYIRARDGTLGVNYSVPVRNQLAVVEKACSSPHRTLLVENHTHVFAQSLEYIASVTGPVGAGVSLE